VALGEAGLGDRELRRQILTMLGEVLAFDSFAWLLADPVTAVGAAPLTEVPRVSELPALIRAKYATPVNRWTILLRQPSPARLLSEATGGELARSRVWREVMSRHGVSDVASAVFADQYGCWGFLDLWRHRRHGPFDSADADLLATLCAPLARTLRRSQARTFIEPAAARRRDGGPVVPTLDDGLRITSRTAASRAWLDVLLRPEPSEQAGPRQRLQRGRPVAVRRGTHRRPPGRYPHASGRWLLADAARRPALFRARGTASAGGGGTIVVTIEEASAADRLDLFGRAFGFTSRERELLSLLAVGSDTRALARQMSLSEHTVQDHLKSIFVETDSRDRITLLSRALGTRLSDTNDRSAARGSLTPD